MLNLLNPLKMKYLLFLTFIYLTHLELFGQNNSQRQDAAHDKKHKITNTKKTTKKENNQGEKIGDDNVITQDSTIKKKDLVSKEANHQEKQIDSLQSKINDLNSNYKTLDEDNRKTKSNSEELKNKIGLKNKEIKSKNIIIYSFVLIVFLGKYYWTKGVKI
jgi:uncharacterized membrane protein